MTTSFGHLISTGRPAAARIPSATRDPPGQRQQRRGAPVADDHRDVEAGTRRRKPLAAEPSRGRRLRSRRRRSCLRARRHPRAAPPRRWSSRSRGKVVERFGRKAPRRSAVRPASRRQLARDRRQASGSSSKLRSDRRRGMRQRADRDVIGAGRPRARESARASRHRRSRLCARPRDPADGLDGSPRSSRLSSRMMSAPAAIASSTCSRLCASISTGSSCRAARIRSTRLADAAGEPDVVVLDQDRVVQPVTGDWSPPPARTAYFSSARSVGVVFRVSRMVMRPPAASTKRRVSVAMPDSRCSRFSAVRSARQHRAGRAADLGDDVAVDTADCRRAVTTVNTHRGIELPERLGRDVEAGDDAVALGHDLAARAQLRVDRRVAS